MNSESVNWRIIGQKINPKKKDIKLTFSKINL